MIDVNAPRLQRKPRKGDLIGFGTFESRPHPDPETYAATGLRVSHVIEPERPTFIVTRTPEGDPARDDNADRLCWIAPLGRDGKPCGEASQFIWYHWTNGRAEGPNLLARIFSADGRQIEREPASPASDSPTFADDLRTMMRGWDEIKERARDQFPSASEDEIDRITRGAMDRALGLAP